MSEELVQITINGKQIQVPRSQNLIKAAASAGVEIPHYCYHSHLSSPAVCRMCLVEVEGVPKLQPACNTPLRDGLTIHTDSPKVKEAVREVLEFTLINHPLDCPVCDQAGECGLHDYYQEYGLYNSRFTLPKVHKAKVVPIGPTIMLDAERCILCSRCVRFCEEVTGTNEMAILQRGDHSEIKAVKPVENDYSTNLADICPVGALTERDFRFRVRVWYLKETSSVCPGCSRGCNISLDHHRGVVQRLRPRENNDVNQVWMCDAGRLFYQRVSNEDRLNLPQIRKQGALVEVSWEEAIEAAVNLLKLADGKVAAQSSAHLSNEDNFALSRLLKALKAPNAATPTEGATGWADDALLRRADRTPNRAGASCFASEASFASLLKDAKVALVAQENVLEKPDGYANLEGLIFVGTHRNATSDAADIVLPVAEWVEYTGTYTNFQGRVQKFLRAIPPPSGVTAAWQLFGKFAAAFGQESFATVEACFDAMAGESSKFAGVRFAQLGNTGVVPGAANPSANSTDAPKAAEATA